MNEESKEVLYPKYAQTYWLRALIQWLPHGGSLDVLLSAKYQDFLQRRIECLAKALLEEIPQELMKKVDKEFLESDDFFSMLITMMEHASKTRSEDKIKAYVKVLRGYVMQEVPIDEAEGFLQTLSELTPTELRLAAIAYRHKKFAVVLPFAGGNTGSNTFIEDCSFVKVEDLLYYMKRLERAGFISEEVGMIIDYEGGAFKITPTFTKIMNLLEDTHQES